MSDRTNYIFRACIFKGSVDKILTDYLKSGSLERSEREMVLGAASAFWMPFAMRVTGCTPQRLRECVLTSIYRLLQHVVYLAQNFGLEQEVRNYFSLSSLGQVDRTTSEQINRAELEPLLKESLSQNQVKVKTSELLHHEDDEMFQAMFE